MPLRIFRNLHRNCQSNRQHIVIFVTIGSELIIMKTLISLFQKYCFWWPFFLNSVRYEYKSDTFMLNTEAHFASGHKLLGKKQRPSSLLALYFY